MFARILPVLHTRWNTTWSWQSGWTHNDWCASQPQYVSTTTPWQVTQKSDNLQVQGPWRTAQARNEMSSHSWQPQIVSEEPTLSLPKPQGPEPVRSNDLSPPPSSEVTNHPPGLRGGFLVASPASSSGAMLRFGPMPIPWFCVSASRISSKTSPTALT